MYCKLIPQQFFDGYKMNYYLEILPNKGIKQKEPIRKFIGLIQVNPNRNTMGQQCHSSAFDSQKVIRKKVILSENEIRFKKKFYSFFTHKKRIPKDLVFIIHNNIAKEINLRNVTREECRSVDKYFKNFAKYQKEITNYLNSLSVSERNQLKSKSNLIKS